MVCDGSAKCRRRTVAYPISHFALLWSAGGWDGDDRNDSSDDAFQLGEGPFRAARPRPRAPYPGEADTPGHRGPADLLLGSVPSDPG
jgi:hypothetical protein